MVGGGDTGNDCVGTAIRHGAAAVTQIEMMPKLPDKRAEDNPWPVWPKVCKTDYGQEEAIAVFGQDPRIYQTTVKEFVKDKNGIIRDVILGIHPPMAFQDPIYAIVSIITSLVTFIIFYKNQITVQKVKTERRKIGY